MKYRHLFFDLDHTLWDFTANSREVLGEIWSTHLSGFNHIPSDQFVAVYEQVNDQLWERLGRGEIRKELLRALRFRETLAHFDVHDTAKAALLDKLYMEQCPRRGRLVPGAMELLEDLHGRYHLHVITNGFTETQDLKLRSCGLRHFFKVVLTSEMAGAAKPSARIFRHALRSAGAKVGDSLMIGDSVAADMAGARAAGIDQVHFAPFGVRDPMATFVITELGALRTVLLGGPVPDRDQYGSKP